LNGTKSKLQKTVPFLKKLAAGNTAGGDVF
jgi:hypothetical protein